MLLYKYNYAFPCFAKHLLLHPVPHVHIYATLFYSILLSQIAVFLGYRYTYPFDSSSLQNVTMLVQCTLVLLYSTLFYLVVL